MRTEENVAASVNDERDDLETMSNEETRSRCKALTKKGERCKNHPPAGSEYCRVHQAAERLAQQADIERTPLEEEGEVAKEQQQRPKRHEWDARACFKVFFEVGTAEHNRGKWQTRVYFEESSKGVKEETDEIAGVQTAPWVNWILERAKSRRVPVEPVPLKTEITAQPIPTEAEAAAPTAPATPYDVQIKILDANVNQSSVAPQKRLVAEARFKISGHEVKTLTKKEIPFEILFRIVNCKSGAANLVASEQGQLNPQTREYPGKQEFPIPDLGRYELETIVLLLPPGEIMAFRLRDPPFRVVPR